MVVNTPELRPHLRRFCPLRDRGCDWQQVTSWFVGSPDTTLSVPHGVLRAEAEAHLLSAHYTIPKQYHV